MLVFAAIVLGMAAAMAATRAFGCKSARYGQRLRGPQKRSTGLSVAPDWAYEMSRNRATYRILLIQ
jgi:hypothetical protein